MAFDLHTKNLQFRLATPTGPFSFCPVASLSSQNARWRRDAHPTSRTRQPPAWTCPRQVTTRRKNSGASAAYNSPREMESAMVSRAQMLSVTPGVIRRARFPEIYASGGCESWCIFWCAGRAAQKVRTAPWTPLGERLLNYYALCAARNWVVCFPLSPELPRNGGGPPTIQFNFSKRGKTRLSRPGWFSAWCSKTTNAPWPFAQRVLLVNI